MFTHRDDRWLCSVKKEVVKGFEKLGKSIYWGKMTYDMRENGEANSKTYRRLHNILLMRHPRCTLDLWKIK